MRPDGPAGHLAGTVRSIPAFSFGSPLPSHSLVLGWVYGPELIHRDGQRIMLLYSLDAVEGATPTGHWPGTHRGFGRAFAWRGATEAGVLTETDNDGGQATYRAAGERRDPKDPVLFTRKLRTGRHSR